MNIKLQKTYETNTGKKIEVVFELDPMKWAENQLSVLKNFYYAKFVAFLKSIIALVVIIPLFSLGKVWVAVILTLLIIVGVGLYLNDMLEARADYKEFQERMESNLVKPDMYKSIMNYCGVTERKSFEAICLLKLDERKVLDYDVSLNKKDGPCFTITTVDIDTGDVKINEFYSVSIIRNIELKHLFIKVTPDGIYLRCPMEISEKEKLA